MRPRVVLCRQRKRLEIWAAGMRSGSYRRFANVLRAGRDDDDDEVTYGQSAASEELHPLFHSRLLAEESRQTGDDEQEVSGGCNHSERQIWSLELTGSQQDRGLLKAVPDERRNEQVDVVPKRSDYAARTETPRAVAASQDNDAEIDQSLKGMENTDPWLKDG